MSLQTPAKIRMREIRTSGLMGGEGKRGGAVRQCSRLSSTLPKKLKKAVSTVQLKLKQIQLFAEVRVLGFVGKVEKSL